jgi:hypothetical protein
MVGRRCLRLIFEAEFYEFREQIGPQIRRILSLRIRDPLPLIRQFRRFAGLIHEFYKEYRFHYNSTKMTFFYPEIECFCDILMT